MNKELQDAYKTVFMDLMTNNFGLLVGRYDASNGSEEYMFGIELVMETIAIRSSEEDYENFTELFTRNIIESQERALKNVKKSLDRFRPR